MVRMLKGAFSWVVYSASAAAIFIGCCCTMILACVSPVHITSRPATIATIAPSLRVLRIAAALLSFMISQRLTPVSMTPDTRNEDAMTCAKVATVVFWKRTAPKSTISARLVTGLIT